LHLSQKFASVVIKKESGYPKNQVPACANIKQFFM